MKAITTIFESILGKDDSLVWTPTNGGPTEFSPLQGWDWGKQGTPERGWDWGKN
jgi:hypothetical protein